MSVKTTKESKKQKTTELPQVSKGFINDQIHYKKIRNEYFKMIKKNTQSSDPT